MASRIGSPAKPSNQPSLPPPTMTPEIAAFLETMPKRASGGRRNPAAGEVWLQSEASADGWIRCRAVEVGMGTLLLLAAQSPTIAQGTWARLASGAATGGTAGVEPDQVRVFPLALFRVGVGASGMVLIECETPVDPGLVARFSLA